jgi:hypothetical protein
VFGAVVEKSIYRGINLDLMREGHFGEGGDCCAHHPQLAGFQVDPQRLAQPCQPFEGFTRAIFQRHDGIQAQPTHDRMGCNFI